MTAILSSGQYFGSVEGRYASGPFQLVETRYDRGQHIPSHRHDQPYFCFVLRGGYLEHAMNGDEFCPPGTVVFHPGGDSHEDQFGNDGGTCFNLECEYSWLRRTASGLDAQTRSIYLRDEYVAWLMRRLNWEVREAAGHVELAIDGLSRALVAAFARRRHSAGGTEEVIKPDWLREVIALCRREYAHQIGLSAMAKIVGIHPRHLARVFRERMGCTLGEYVRRLRVEAACSLLSDSSKPLSRIAFLTGFADQSHLTRTFKKHMGTTPSEYRRRSR